MSKEIYFKLGSHKYYKISEGKGVSLNTSNGTFKNLKTVPSGNLTELKIISQDEFERKLKNIGF